MSQNMTYETIRRIVKDTRQQGSTLIVTFACPITEKTVESRATMSSSSTDLSTTVNRSIVTNLMRSLQRWLYRLLGRNFAGRVGRDVARQATRGVSQKLRFSRAEKNHAVVEAFRRVQSEFVWDSQTDHWIHKSAEEVLA